MDPKGWVLVIAGGVIVIISIVLAIINVTLEKESDRLNSKKKLNYMALKGNFDRQFRLHGVFIITMFIGIVMVVIGFIKVAIGYIGQLFQ